MIFGGIQKTSLIDFPSKISCVLFTAGCNFHCPYCHNPELVRPPFAPLSLDEIFDFLKKRAGLLDGVVITGGEPTLHADLPDFCDQIKAMGFLIKLDSNGSHPKILRTLIQSRRVDYIAMDIKTVPENYAPHLTSRIPPEDLYESIDLIKRSGLAHEFRTTCVSPFVNLDIIEKIARIAQGADRFVLQQGVITPSVLNPEFFENPDFSHSSPDLLRFQEILRPFVTKISIR